jgi:hypothetical protein
MARPKAVQQGGGIRLVAERWGMRRGLQEPAHLLTTPPTKAVQRDGIFLQIDQRWVPLDDVQQEGVPPSEGTQRDGAFLVVNGVWVPIDDVERDGAFVRLDGRWVPVSRPNAAQQEAERWRIHAELQEAGLRAKSWALQEASYLPKVRQKGAYLGMTQEAAYLGMTEWQEEAMRELVALHEGRGAGHPGQQQPPVAQQLEAKALELGIVWDGECWVAKPDEQTESGAATNEAADSAEEEKMDTLSPVEKMAIATEQRRLKQEADGVVRQRVELWPYPRQGGADQLGRLKWQEEELGLRQQEAWEAEQQRLGLVAGHQRHLDLQKALRGRRQSAGLEKSGEQQRQPADDLVGGHKRWLGYRPPGLLSRGDTDIQLAARRIVQHELNSQRAAQQAAGRRRTPQGGRLVDDPRGDSDSDDDDSWA